jgi:hypothetical protein
MLTITGTVLTNTDGMISANDQTLRVTSSTINGGNITLSGTSALQMNNQHHPERNGNQQLEWDDRGAVRFSQHAGRHHQQSGGRRA